jgi:hypothetical protein
MHSAPHEVEDNSIIRDKLCRFCLASSHRLGDYQTYWNFGPGIHRLTN